MSRADADVLIAGGGLAAQRCCECLRRLGFPGRIVMLCEESSEPYDRPPLSKAVLRDEREPHKLAFKPAQWYAKHGVELLLGIAAQELDLAEQVVALRACRNGAHVGNLRYGQLVIATGSRPRRLPGLAPGAAVHALRTYSDALALRGALRDGNGRIVVLGAGLVGMEVAASACALGRDVTMIEAAPTPLARALPPALGRWIADLHRARGIDLRLATSVVRASLRGSAVRLGLSNGSAIDADTVLVAVGAVPATEWLASCGLGPGPIPTDACGRTGCPGVYAAGDAACFPDPYVGEHVPTQHWEAAVRQGTAVARAILGLAPAPPAPAMFWSDQHGHRVQLVGHAPTDGEISLQGEPAEGPFAAWITHAGRPQGALLVDRPDLLPRARQWIDQGASDTRRAA